MLLLGGILLAVFVVPWPWGIVTVLVGGLLDVAETFAFLWWSKRRRSSVGTETLVGQRAVVATPTPDPGPSATTITRLKAAWEGEGLTLVVDDR